jgi:hypothetical protein
MVNVTRDFTVGTPMPMVVAYLQDFARTEEWDPGTKICTRIGSGPVQVGTQWRNVSVFRGRETELIYRLARLDNDRLVFIGENKSVTARDDICLVSRRRGRGMDCVPVPGGMRSRRRPQPPSGQRGGSAACDDLPGTLAGGLLCWFAGSLRACPLPVYGLSHAARTHQKEVPP